MKAFLSGAALLAALTTSPAGAVNVYGIDLTGQLVTFDSATPGTIASTTVITGVSGLSLVGIDFRPATGALYGYASNALLYTIDTATGVATRVGAAQPPVTLNGTNFGFAFNPVADRIRVVSDADQNLRLNPNDNTLSGTDGTLAYSLSDPNAGANPNIVAVGYTNSFSGATTTTLYGLDSNLDTLVVINPPNNGTLTTVGALGFNIAGDASLDIASDGRTGNFGFFSSGTGFYSINLTTGAGTLLGTTAGLRNIAIGEPTAVAVPEPASWAMLIVGFGIVGAASRRRRNTPARTA